MASPTLLPVAHGLPDTVATLLFLEHAKHSPTLCLCTCCSLDLDFSPSRNPLAHYLIYFRSPSQSHLPWIPLSKMPLPQVLHSPFLLNFSSNHLAPFNIFYETHLFWGCLSLPLKWKVLEGKNFYPFCSVLPSQSHYNVPYARHIVVLNKYLLEKNEWMPEWIL